MTGLTAVLLLVALATLVATGARHWRIPAPSLLVVVGVAIGLLPWVPAVHVPPTVISVVVLPPLLYASAEELTWRELGAVWRPVAVLAFGLVLASAATVAWVASALTPLGTSMAFVLGAVLASTDPVAVTALGRRLALPPRVQVMVQSESLLNDATSLVLFKVAVGMAVIGAVSLPRAAGEFVILGGGGAAVGALVAALVALIRRRTEDPVLETVIALFTPYAAYVAAEDLHTSGVTAVVVAGMALGSSGHRLTSAANRLQVHAVYQTVVFLLESAVFAIIGLELPSLVRDLAPDGRGWVLGVLATAITVLAVRLLWVFPLSALMQHRSTTSGPISWRVPAVLSWAGTRGVMPLAAALSIPLTAASGAPLPHRALVLVLTAGVVVLTLVVQGFSLASVVRRSGIALEPQHTAREEARVYQRLAEVGLARLDEVAVTREALPEAVVDRLRRSLEARRDHAGAQLQEDRDPAGTAVAAHRDLRRAVIAMESAELQRLYESRQITDTTRRRVQRALDLEETGLGD